jgi:hypothetical protein
MNKKYLIISFLCIVITLAGCSGISSKQENIYTNDEQIVAEGDTYSYLSRIGSKDSIDNINQINLQFSKFYGSDTLWNIICKGKQKLELNFISEITRGMFKAVLITPAEEVLVIFEGSDDGTKSIDIDEGKYRFKIVGQGAGGRIQIGIEENTNIELEKNE